MSSSSSSSSPTALFMSSCMQEVCSTETVCSGSALGSATGRSVGSTAVTTNTCTEEEVCRPVNICSSSSSSPAATTYASSVFVATTATTTVATTTDACDGCNCVQTIELSPGESTTITSPSFPSNYPNNQECRWRIITTSGNLSLDLPKFNLESQSQCRDDYLLVAGPIKNYRKAKLCGANVSQVYFFLTFLIFLFAASQQPFLGVQVPSDDCQVCIQLQHKKSGL